MSPSLGVAEATGTTYHSQSPRLLLLMSPSLGVAEETGTTYHSQSPRLLDKISQQPENCENRNDPDLVQAFLKKWWAELDFKRWRHQ
jgi:hypothetical protein